jgi:hypothetical protein
MHQSQVLGRHRVRYLTSFRELADTEITLQQHLDHSQSMRMPEDAEAFGRLGECLQIGEYEFVEHRISRAAVGQTPWMIEVIDRNIPRCNVVQSDPKVKIANGPVAKRTVLWYDRPADGALPSWLWLGKNRPWHLGSRKYEPKSS